MAVVCQGERERDLEATGEDLAGRWPVGEKVENVLSTEQCPDVVELAADSRPTMDAGLDFGVAGEVVDPQGVDSS